MLVRRSSDNTTQAIGFTANGYCDTAAITTFVGANNGFVVTWYDQGTPNDLSWDQSATAARQARIVNAGVLDTQAGFVAPFFIAANSNWYGLQSGLSGNNYTVLGVVYNNNNNARVLNSSNTNGYQNYLINSGANSRIVVSKNTVIEYGNTAYAINAGIHQIFSRAGNSSGTITLGYDGTYTSISATPTFSASPSLQYWGLNFANPANSYFDGCCYEWITYGSLIADVDRDAIVANQKAYWGTP
tara:strand:+ start:1569 stop:2300 length:732 start_codon:yes stop_codon:yes gene_type:complete